MYSEAIKAFSKALKINPNINDALVRRGKAYLALKKYDSCMNDFANSIGKYPYHDSTIFLFRSYAFESIGEEKKYKQDLDSVLKFTKSLKVLHNALGMVKSEMQDYNGALLEFNKAINIDKEYLHAIKNRALVYYLLNNLEQAFVDSQTYIKWFPEDKEMNFIKAIHFFSIKKYEETLLYINKCKSKLKTKQVYFLSGAANYFLANDAESIKDLSIALTINPTPQEAAEMYNLIGVCKNNQKPKSGCADILRAINQGSIDAKQNFTADGCN
jgi:tetratricopeptide (TPR) repeat protein